MTAPLKQLVVSPRRRLINTIVRAQMKGGAAYSLFSNAFGWSIRSGYQTDTVSLVLLGAATDWIAEPTTTGALLREVPVSGSTSTSFTTTKLIG